MSRHLPPCGLARQTLAGYPAEVCMVIEQCTHNQLPTWNTASGLEFDIFPLNTRAGTVATSGYITITIPSTVKFEFGLVGGVTTERGVVNGILLVKDRNIQLKSSSITDCVLCLLLSAQLRLFLVDQQFVMVSEERDFNFEGAGALALREYLCIQCPGPGA
ncbi:hypothetical protein B0H13DRAFT_1860953 [Mycena leptocephala]|nr:hypothetical protein B0H13DRAFT_1860953 [Mycena leptocephala]